MANMDYENWKDGERIDVKLIEHNTSGQENWGACDDTTPFLEEGEIYEAVVEVHSWHTKLIINGKKFNSVCFERME